MSLSKHVGERVKRYRKQNNYTVQELADLIHKSKSTLSKYEHGLVVIDIDTLEEISRALNVSIYQLIDLPFTMPADVKKPDSPLMDLFNAPIVYMYFFDGRLRQMNRSVLEIHGSGENEYVMMYLDVKNLSAYRDCRCLFQGYRYNYHSLVRYSLINCANSLEEVMIYILNPMGNFNEVTGMLSGLSSKPLMPISIKCIFSPYKLKEDDELIQKLHLNKTEAASMRRINMFTVYPDI